jgi:hypothetical protein
MCSGAAVQKINSPRRQFLREAASKHDLAPSVSAEHLKLAWQLRRDFHAQNPGEPVCFALGTLRGLLPDGVDVCAVDYRAGLLNKLHYVLANYAEKLGHENPISRLNRFRHQQDFDDCVIRVMARIPVEWMQMGYIYSGWPFDVDEFVHQVELNAT